MAEHLDIEAAETRLLISERCIKRCADRYLGMPWLTRVTVNNEAHVNVSEKMKPALR
jgi:hypothetical protein